MYDNTTRIHATREIELLICNGALEVIVASTELEEESVEESDVGMADEAVDARVLLRGSVIDGEAEDITADAKDRVDAMSVGSSPPCDPSNLPEGAAMSLKGDCKSFLYEEWPR
jgi:hypothetical protein